MPPLRVGTLGERLAEQLRERIITGELEHETRLVEDAIALEFDVSRGPVRDAFRILEAEGLVLPQRKGVTVRGFDEDDLDEVYSLRLALETLACTLVRANSDHVDFEAMTQAVHDMDTAAEDHDWHRFSDHDLTFHTEIYVQCGHTRLLAMWRQILPVFTVLLQLTNSVDIDLHPAADDHQLLLDLLRTGSEARLKRVLTDHLNGSRARMIQAMRTG